MYAKKMQLFNFLNNILYILYILKYSYKFFYKNDDIYIIYIYK